MKTFLSCAIVLGLAAVVAPASAAPQSVTVDMHAVSSSGIGESIGTIEIVELADGVEFRPHLRGLPQGERGFHVHQHADCSPKEKDGKMVAALAAGGHYDPKGTGKHTGPAGGGHMGDLSRLLVDENGTSTKSVHVPGLKLSDITGRSLMIHAGGDTYSDTPKPLGGGGDRIACGVIK